MSGDSARLKGQSVHTAAGMHCCSNRGGCSATGWLWLEHHRAVTRGTSHFHANQCHGDPAALWCKWVVTTHGDGDEVEERGDLGDFVKVEALNSSFHATSIHPVRRVWSITHILEANIQLKQACVVEICSLQVTNTHTENWLYRSPDAEFMKWRIFACSYSGISHEERE